MGDTAVGTSFSVGNVEVACFTDAEIDFPVPLSILFPDASEADWRASRERFPNVFASATSWRVHFGSHLLRTSGQTILVDTGIGPNPSDRLGGRPGKLLEELASAGVSPGDIDIVFISHSHADHIGWNLNADGSSRFPNARFVISQKEWDWLPGRGTRAGRRVRGDHPEPAPFERP
jgi:glyoxylase-like metal-dependent hydrolase (beta-lactamase superfamily II)